MGSRSERKKIKRVQLRSQSSESIKDKFSDRFEEFKLNRKGKTKRKRTDVKARYRKVDRSLTAMIVIIGLLLIISWIIILFY